jgi:hypothetical protein
MMKKDTLIDAINNLDEKSTLIFEKAKDIPKSSSKDFYIDRPNNPLQGLITTLIHTQSYDKILFSGHMGCGKSTELNRLVSEKKIQDNFFLIKYSISEVLNIIDIDYIDFLLSFTATLYMKANDEGIVFGKEISKSIEKWIEYFKNSNKDFEKIGEELPSKTRIYAFFKNITSILLRELTMRDAVRDAIKRNITSLANIINSLVNEIQSKLDNKKLLIVIDDLEKIPDINKAENLFVQAGTYMTVPKCKIIYTVPIALFYSIKFKQLSDVFSEPFILPNIKVYDSNDRTKLDPTGCLEKFLEKRIDLALIDKDAKDNIIQFSGGIPRELVRILKDCCIKAITKERDSISIDIVNDVISNLRNSYDRGLQKRHYDLLNLINNGEKPDDESTLMELFHSKVVLEYQNGTRWTAINPIVEQLLNK